MSRFDDELRRAVAPLAGEPLPDDLLDEALDGSANPQRQRLAAAATTVALLAVIAVGVGVGRLMPEPSPDPSDGALPSPTADPSPQTLRHEIEVDGVRMIIELESDRAIDGEPVYLTVSVENVGDRSVYWSQTGCLWSTHVLVSPAPVFERGRSWDGEAAELKQRLLSVPWGHDIAPFNFGPAEHEPRPSTGCFMSGAGRQELAPGASVTDELAWLPEGPFGMPLPTQGYEISATFPIIPATGDDHNDRDPSDNVTLAFEVVVEGSDADYLMPGEAADIILADGRLWDLLVDARPGRPGIGELEWVDGLWRMSLSVGQQSGGMFRTTHFITAEVDALTGALVLPTRGTTEAPPEPAPDTAEVEGVVRFTLSLDRDRTTPGQPIWAELTVENLGSEDLSWATTGGCPLWPAARSQDPPDDEPYGRTDWRGDADVLKSVIVGDGPDPEHPFRPEEYIGVVNSNWGCDLIRVPETIGAGERFTYRSIWYAETRAGVPVKSGSYDVDAELGVFGIEEPLTVSVPLTVIGEDFDWLAPGEALDRFLEDAQFQDLLREYPRGRWNSQDLVFEDDRWKLRIYVSASPTDLTDAGAVLGTLDALTGHIYGVRFDPDTRPPGFESEP